MIRIVLLSLLLIGLSFAQNIEIHGAIKSAMHGDLSAKFNLDDIKDRQNIYGIGAVNNLKGEITVIDSKPYVSYVLGDRVVVDSTFNHQAALFFFSDVSQWATDMPESPFDPAKLQKILSQKNGLQSAPLTFLIEGKVQSLKWHVIDWQEGDTLHTPERHRASGLHGDLQDQQVTLMGFYSENHKGILTHHNSSLHIHFINREKTLAGHVDDFLIKEAVLKTGKMPSK
jgi:alpha-acetolactate decarboxylase